MSLDLVRSIISRLRRGPAEREKFVDSHVRKEIATQIRAIRDKFGWSQTELCGKVGMNQNAISRLESAEYGKPTITTLKRLAAAFDVGLVVRFVPFSEMAYWVSGTTHGVKGLSTESLVVPNFNAEEKQHVFDALAIAAELMAKKGPAREDLAELNKKASGEDRREPAGPANLLFFPQRIGIESHFPESRSAYETAVSLSR